MLTSDEAYKTIFCEYPDVVNVKQLCKMLGGIGEKTGFRLLQSGKIRGFRIGRTYRISKLDIIDYVTGVDAPVS